MKKYFYLLLIITSTFFLGCSSDDNSNSNNINSSWENIPFSGDDGYGIYSSCSSGNDLYIGTITNGVFKSSDGGVTWTSISNGIIDKKNCKVYSNNNVLYVTTSVICPNCNPINKIYKSVDNGNNWIPIWEILNNNGVIPNPTVGNLSFIDLDIYASRGTSVYKSSNNGVNWQLVFTNPDTSFPGTVNKVLKMNNTIFLNVTDGGGVFKSTNGGNNFTILNNINFNNVEITTITATNNNFYMATGTFSDVNTRGVYISDENAISFQLFNQDFNINPSSTIRFGCLFSFNNIIYLSCNNNFVYKSSNNGINWQKLGDKVDANLNSIPDRNLLTINNKLFLITANKIYKYNL
jgi:photosystem II stability/assembly factor-like uncharacterized protein